jgi:hypothetical protein
MNVCMAGTVIAGQRKARSSARCTHASAWQSAVVQRCMVGLQCRTPRKVQARKGTGRRTRGKDGRVRPYPGMLPGKRSRVDRNTPNKYCGDFGHENCTKIRKVAVQNKSVGTDC